jgi:hypothetical protein
MADAAYCEMLACCQPTAPTAAAFPYRTLSPPKYTVS